MRRLAWTHCCLILGLTQVQPFPSEWTVLIRFGIESPYPLSSLAGSELLFITLISLPTYLTYYNYKMLQCLLRLVSLVLFPLPGCSHMHFLISFSGFPESFGICVEVSLCYLNSSGRTDLTDVASSSSSRKNFCIWQVLCLSGMLSCVYFAYFLLHCAVDFIFFIKSYCFKRAWVFVLCSAFQSFILLPQSLSFPPFFASFPPFFLFPSFFLLFLSLALRGNVQDVLILSNAHSRGCSNGLAVKCSSCRELECNSHPHDVS